MGPEHTGTGSRPLSVVSTNGPRRAKTSPESNDGSFAPRSQTSPGPAARLSSEPSGDAPTETIPGHLIKPGDVLIVDGEERTVHETFTVVRSSHSHEGAGVERIVAFESFDREPDGTPTAILERSFDAAEDFIRVADTRPAYERLDYGTEGSMQVDEPYQHLSLDTSNRRARQMISEIRDGWMDVNPPYQRGSVWSLTQRQGLIRSIKQGIPIPAIYINDRTSPDWVRANGPETLDTGIGMYAVVDGRQRCEAMMAWYDSEFGVPASWFDPEHVESTFETADGPYVTMSHLTEVGRRLFDNRAMLPVTTARVATVEDEAALYLLVNGAGTAQTDEDLANAAAVAGR